MLASITAYGIGLFIHIAAVVLVFGPTFAYPFMFAVAGKSGLEASIAAMKTTDTIARFLIIPGQIVLLLAGVYLVNKADWGWGTSWVDVGIVAIVVLMGMTHAFFMPTGRKAIAAAERDLAAGGTPSEELQALAQKLATGGQIAGIIVLVTVFFMAVKP